MVYYKKHVLFGTLSMNLGSVKQGVLDMISIHCKVISVSLHKMSFTYGITFINLITIIVDPHFIFGTCIPSLFC
jgi:hypothetical protein